MIWIKSKKLSCIERSAKNVTIVSTLSPLLERFRFGSKAFPKLLVNHGRPYRWIMVWSVVRVLIRIFDPVSGPRWTTSTNRWRKKLTTNQNCGLAKSVLHRYCWKDNFHFIYEPQFWVFLRRQQTREISKSSLIDFSETKFIEIHWFSEFLNFNHTSCIFLE